MESVGNKAGKPLRDTYGNVFEVPNFTFKEIRDAIPAHCFKRSAWRSFSYVARDIALISATFYAFQFHIIPALEGFEHAKLARGLAWSLYTVLQGFYGTGLWVLAHECGHQAFSESKALNDFVGWVLHSILLVPYFSWKLSHYKHHASTGNVEKDMAHVPKSRFAYMRKHEVSDVSEMAEETPLWTLFQFVVVQQLLGWFIYLFTNATGHNYHSRQKEGRGKGGKRNGFFGGVNHFDPSSPIYESKESHLIIYSDIGIALVIAAVWAASAKWGFGNVMIWYGIPYLWVNH